MTLLVTVGRLNFKRGLLFQLVINAIARHSSSIQDLEFHKIQNFDNQPNICSILRLRYWLPTMANRHHRDVNAEYI